MAGRIQRKRTPGWRMPAGGISITRPGQWGNPFAVAEHGLEKALQLFEQYARKRLLTQPGWLEPLRGKDLACWCNPAKDCHGDVLLRLLAERAAANSETG